MTTHASPLENRTLDTLVLDDEASFRHISLYGDLKEVLRRAGYAFHLLPAAARRWDRALFLNLTFWQGGSDVLIDEVLPADVVTHVAWHHLAAKAFAQEPPSTDALLLGEAIASAFDVYLIGRMLHHAPDSAFLESQMPALATAVQEAGMSEAQFAALLETVAADPDRAFEDLRELLFDATTGLLQCTDTESALALLTDLDRHRFGPLLHHYELSNWVLSARALPAAAMAPNARVREVDRALREAPVALDWLEKAWVLPGMR